MSQSVEERTPRSRPELMSHYREVAKSYHKTWFYDTGGPFESWEVERIKHYFQVSFDGTGIVEAKSLKIVDIGGGTGRIAHLLQKAFSTYQPVLCVDPSADMLKEARLLRGVTVRHMDAWSFCSGFETRHRETIDRVLMKEMIHHIDGAKLRELFTSLYQILSTNGRVLVLKRPNRLVEYPFFPGVLNVWEKIQPHGEHIVSTLKSAGFEVVSLSLEEFPVTIPLDQWVNMIKNRMWSYFSHFSDSELEAGTKYIREKFHSAVDDGILKFNDRFEFILALKKPSLSNAD